jgi:hypothetical protein
MDRKRERWDQGYRTQLTCDVCHDSIYSKVSGEYVSCQCGNVSIDQTPYYTRLIGGENGYISLQINLNEVKDEQNF